jgi:DNA-binding transcriptional ArsR family regulator
MGDEATVDPQRHRDGDLLRKLADALADPLRVRLLSAITERPGISVREMAAWVGEAPRKVRYHVDALLSLGLIEIQGEARRRGAIEHQYRATTSLVLGSEEGRLISAAQGRRISVEVLKMVMADATGSVASGHFGGREGHAEVRLRGEVDEDGWNELSDLFVRTAEEAQDIIDRGAARLAETDEPGVQLTGALLLFEAPIWNRK